MQPRASDHVPTDAYLSFVTSLFGNRRTLFLSMGIQTLCFLLVYRQSGADFYLYFSGVFFAVGLLRSGTMTLFDMAGRSRLDRSDIARWERRYLYGAVATTSLLGIAAGYAIYELRSPFGELVCVAAAMISIASVVGRNYGSRIAVDLQSASVCLPILAACLWTGDIYMIVLGVLLVVMVLTTRQMATAVREVLFKNVIASREVAKIADSFDIALNNMTHGLLMLDQHNRIQVINRKACELLQLGEHYRLKNCDLEIVLRFGVRHTFVDGAMPAFIQKQLMQLINGTISRAMLHFSDELILEFSANRQQEGGVVLIFEDVTGRVRSERKILHMVRYDALTGLPNRTYFAELVKERLALVPPEQNVGFLLLDINDFKHVNDMKGHATGDRLLAGIADQLTQLAGSDVLLAHLLGDRFVLFFGASDDPAAAMAAFHESVADTCEVDGTTFRIAMSAGGVVLPAATMRFDEWQIKADLALYDSKSRGKGVFALFVNEMDARYLERQRLKTDLRDAIETSGLSVAYQPMYRPDGGLISCCEALSRWTHPQKGAIPPNIFIEIAEEMGVVCDITRFMVERACRDCMTWPEHISVSVNLSEHDLRNGDIVETVRKALANSGLPPARLHLEVTESSLIEELSVVSQLLEELRGLGIRIAIDDFGTGFSSLSYLDRLPVDIVKIDRSFVRDITADSRRFKLLRGIVNLSRQLDLEIVVEGVETAAQLSVLNDYRCADLVQGYVFSMPVAADRINELSERAGASSATPGRTRVA